MNDGDASRIVTPLSTVVDGRMTLEYACLEYSWLVHGTVVFKDEGFEGPDSAWRECVAEFARRNVNPEPRKVSVPVQVHGSRVIRERAGGGFMEAPTCDGIVTGEPRLLIGVSTADCVPLLAVNEPARVIGVAHCGWRGIAQGVVESFIEEMEAAALDARAGRSEGTGREAHGPGGMRFVMGASVGACCYAVGEDFLRAFSGREVEECAEHSGGRTVFDLRRLIGMRLSDRGIDRAQIFADNTCTSCAGDMLCSYRAGGKSCGRMYTFLMIAS